MNDIVVLSLILIAAIPSWCIAYIKYKEMTNKNFLYSNVCKLIISVGVSIITFSCMNKFKTEYNNIYDKLSDIEQGIKPKKRNKHQ